MTETLANGYSSESTQRDLSNEYQHDRVCMVFKKLCVFVLWAKVASALEGLSISIFTWGTIEVILSYFHYLVLLISGTISNLVTFFISTVRYPE